MFKYLFVGVPFILPPEEEGLSYRTSDGRVSCLKCFQTFSSMNNAQRHYKSKHLMPEKVTCRFCQKTYKNVHSHNEHLRTSHGITQAMLKTRVLPKF